MPLSWSCLPFSVVASHASAQAFQLTACQHGSVPLPARVSSTPWPCQQQLTHLQAIGFSFMPSVTLMEVEAVLVVRTYRMRYL